MCLLVRVVTESVMRVGDRRCTVVAESFGAWLVLKSLSKSPRKGSDAFESSIERLLLINPASNFPVDNAIAALAASTGILSVFPLELYSVAQDILWPLMVRRTRLSDRQETRKLFSPIELVPAATASWRLQAIANNPLSEAELRRVKQDTVVFCGAKDRVLDSMQEGTRLQTLMPNARRIILPDSGHTALLEDGINLHSMIQDAFPRILDSKARGSMDAESEDHHSTDGLPREDDAQITSDLSRRVAFATSDEDWDKLGKLLSPWKVLTSPVISGLENLPDPKEGRSILFVANHTLFGIYDLPVLLHELYLRGFRCRGLAHPLHWLSPVGSLFERFGAIKATPFAVYKLLKEGQCVLLFPGGAREVTKRKGEDYQLKWREETDFVRMAAKLDTIIVPVSAVGGDTAFDIAYDTDDILRSPVGPAVRSVLKGISPQIRAEEAVYPVVYLPGTSIPSPIPIPSIERLYFHFGAAVDPREANCTADDSGACQILYDQVKDEVERNLSMLLEKRTRDRERAFIDRVWTKGVRLLTEE
eukprot:scaffold614_cov367-Prasinococcus_capsulatus_cf.AAC.12